MKGFYKAIYVLIISMVISSNSFSREVTWGLPGGSLTWDSQINMAISSSPCADINDAIADAMDTSTTGFSRVRVHMGNAESVSLTVEDDYEDVGPNKGCVIAHPVTDASTYPLTVTTEDSTLQTGLNSAPQSKLFLYFDNVRPEIVQTGMTENACFLDMGAGYVAGHSDTAEPPDAIASTETWYGRLGENVVVAGRIDARITAGLDAGWDDQVIPAASGSAKLNNDSTSAHAIFCAHHATYADFSDLTLTVDGQDDDDIFGRISNSWGIKLPAFQSTGSTNEGIGLQFTGVNNTEPNSATHLRQFDYGVVLGDGVEGGNTVHYSSCAAPAAACALDDERGVRGVELEGINEGHTYALLVDYGGETENKINMFHECGSSSCSKAGILLKPFACDGTTGTTPITPAGTPVALDEATECAASGGDSTAPASADNLGDGVIVFGGDRTPNGGSSSDAIILGENFDGDQTVIFADGVMMGRATDAGLELITPHSALTRSSQADEGDSLAASVGCVDTSGAYFAGGDTTVLPTNYDCWVDSREQIIAEFIWMEGANNDSGNSINSAGGGGATECFSWNEPFPKDNASSCTNDFNVYGRYPHQTYFTRALVSASQPLTTTEGCGFLIHSTSDYTSFDPGTGGTAAVFVHMPWADGQDFAQGESYGYNIQYLHPPGNGLLFEGGDGDFSESGTPTCVGSNFTVWTQIRGYFFDPFD